MSDDYPDINYQPTSYADATLYADRWYHDSGFIAYLRGFCAGSGIDPIGSGDRKALLRWARTQVEEDRIEEQRARDRHPTARGRDRGEDPNSLP